MPVIAAVPARNLWAMAHIPAGLRNMPGNVRRDLPSAPSTIEQKVFGNKKFYSITLNMPNLNSRSGSWVIRFAELNEDRQEGELTAPVVVDKVDPAYPGILMREHITGTVTLYAVIGADGSVGDVRVLSGVDGRLDAAARDALRHCHFRPATKNGQAVALEAVIRIPFEVHRIPY
jgi:TonB family protein